MELMSLFACDFFKNMPLASEEADAREIERLVLERSEARKSRDWARADEIRDSLRKMNVILEDGPNGTTWRFDV